MRKLPSTINFDTYDIQVFIWGKKHSQENVLHDTLMITVLMSIKVKSKSFSS